MLARWRLGYKTWGESHGSHQRVRRLFQSFPKWAFSRGGLTPRPFGNPKSLRDCPRVITGQVPVARTSTGRRLLAHVDCFRSADEFARWRISARASVPVPCVGGAPALHGAALYRRLTRACSRRSPRAPARSVIRLEVRAARLKRRPLGIRAQQPC